MPQHLQIQLNQIKIQESLVHIINKWMQTGGKRVQSRRLVNIQTVTRIYDRKRNAYFLRFQSAHGLDLTDTFSCFDEKFDNLEEHKAYDIRELLGRDE